MRRFPNNFLWGAATSPHQVEGNNDNSDWWQAEQSGKTLPSGIACNHYNLFRQDFKLAKELGHNSHRLGIEWSRLEKSEGKWSDEEWSHYRSIFEELKSLDIKPVVTLNHFTLPAWLAEKGGWEDPCIIDLFARFAEKAVKELGEFVEYWIPLNEPQVLAFIGFFKGDWPPYKKSFDDMLTVTRNMLKAHVAAYTGMKNAVKNDPLIFEPQIGIAKAVSTFHPCRKFSIPDNISAYLRAHFQNHAFIKSAVKGKMQFFPYIYDELPAKNTVDFIGINYYFREFVHHRHPIWVNPFGWLCSHGHHENAGKRTNMGWEIYPKGLDEVLNTFSKYRLPIIITENGLSTDDDNIRKEYIKGHLRWLLNSINTGIPVIGYLYWSLLDNFEWAEGYKQRFGLIEVDYETQERKIRDSARYYAEIIRSGKVPD